jgi:hypothetical protein
MLSVSLPNKVEDLLPVLQEIVRRSVDGTVPPIIVDVANQRILIGASTATTTNIGKVEITGGDLKIVSGGYGLIIPNRAGTAYYRLVIDNDGAISADPL